jgi:hypothetical protein
MEPDYKRVLCLLIGDGALTREQVVAKIDLLKEQEGDKYDTPTWQSAIRLTEQLHTRMRENSKKPCALNVTSYASIEKLLRIDKKTEEEVAQMIDWCQADEFWHSVILSTTKLRKHFDTMASQRERRGVVRIPNPVLEFDAAAHRQSIIDSMREVDERRQKEQAEMAPVPSSLLREALRGK